MKAACRVILSISIILLAVHQTNRILMPKWREHQYYNALETPEGFYNLEKNSVDVLLIGSSHCFYNFSPQEIYNRYKIRSYNLGTPGQNLICSYFILKEALQYQKPQAVVLETLYFFNDNADPWNEGAHRKAISYMRWSPAKICAIHHICKATPTLDKASFYLSNLRFHSRWQELSMEDFVGNELASHTETKGYLPIRSQGGETGYHPFDEDSSDEREAMGDVNEEYVTRIIEACKENGIKLIFAKAPAKYWSPQSYNTVMDLAEAFEIPFYDMNIRDNFAQLDHYDYATDGIDALGHANIRGAAKLSDYLGSVLIQEGVQGQVDRQWEETASYHEGLKKDDQLQFITDPHVYLEAISDQRYTVFFALNGELSEEYEAITADLNQRFGLLNFHADEDGAYIGIVDQGVVVYDKIDNENNMHFCTSIKNGAVYTELISEQNYSGGNAWIAIRDINGRVEYSKNEKGLNVVVYDCYNMSVIDVAVIDVVSDLGIKR